MKNNFPVLDLGKTVKEGLEKNGMIGWQFNTIGVSDAITMSNQGKCWNAPALSFLEFIG